MRTTLFAVIAALSLLAGCRQAEDQPSKDSAKSAPVLPITDAGARAAAPVSKEAALKVMHERHEGMEKIGKATKALGREMEAASPDLATIRTSAATIAGLAPKVGTWFPSGSGPEVGKTHARAEIWQKPEDYAAKTKDFQTAAVAFNTAAQGGNMADVKPRFDAMMKTCKACHEGYRRKHD